MSGKMTRAALVTICFFVAAGGFILRAQSTSSGQQSKQKMSFNPRQVLDSLPPYVPQAQVSGVIRNFGNNYIPSLMNRWEEGFRNIQPDVKFETRLPGSEAAMAGLYGGVADIAFIGRESYKPEVQAFSETMGYAPLGIEISSGSFMTPHKTFALMVFVHKSNPIARMTLPQLARIFGCLRRDAGRPIEDWGDLGLEGKWKHRQIHVYGYGPTTGMARFFQHTVLGDGNTWSDRLIAFENGHQPNGEVINAGVYIMQALAKDPSGIAFANFLYSGPDVRAVALARGRESVNGFHDPTWNSVFLRQYPLSRFTTAFVNRSPGKPLDSTLREFLLYILSREGMQAVVDDGSYVPLNAKQIAVERKKLE